jgi:flavin-dependent dehydrogenase
MKVLVVGGGPAGSVTAIALAQAGLTVSLIDGAEFPRYHIGESLTPSCRSVLEAVGVAGKVDEHGFVIKHGGAFRWNSDSWLFDWGKQVGARSWQVDRAEFDALLLEHAWENGVSVRTGVAAKSVEFDGERPVAVHCRPKSGEDYVIDDFDFLVDASGRHGLLSMRHFHDREPLQNLRNVATWGYWTGASVLPDTPIGGINIISSDEGWYWVIPLAGERTSIGYVTTKEAFARDRVSSESLDDLYRRLVSTSETLKPLVVDATQVGAARSETDYSYIAERFCGPGFVIVGDAACFLDPLLSTGVHLALYSALTAAACIASVERGEATEQEGLLFFEFAFRRAFTRLFALVSVMYERYLGKDGFFRTSDRLIGDGVEEQLADGLSSTSFAEIIAGLSDLREATDSSTRVLTDRLREEALKVQLRALGDAAGPSMPDFTSVLENPLRDAESAHFRLVTSPRLGLERMGEQQP